MRIQSQKRETIRRRFGPETARDSAQLSKFSTLPMPSRFPLRSTGSSASYLLLAGQFLGFQYENNGVSILTIVYRSFI